MGPVQKRAFAFKRMVIFDQPSLDIKKKVNTYKRKQDTSTSGPSPRILSKEQQKWDRHLNPTVKYVPPFLPERDLAKLSTSLYSFEIRKDSKMCCVNVLSVSDLLHTQPYGMTTPSLSAFPSASTRTEQ